MELVETGVSRNAVIVVDPKETEAALTVRRLLDEATTEAGQLAIRSMSEIRESIHNLHSVLDPRDIERPPRESVLRYDQRGRLGISFRMPGSSGTTTPMSFTANGYKQYGDRVLGSGGRKFVAAQAKRGEASLKLAEINWAMECSQMHQALKLRTIQLPGQPTRSVRAALSQSYGYFDNADVLDTLMEYEGIADLPVVNVRVDENAMRIRFCLDPDQLSFFRGDKSFDRLGINHSALNKPLKIGELWNSEIGLSSVRFMAGIWLPRCMNGMASWSDHSEWKWFHRCGGSGADHRSRISKGLSQALDSARIQASGVVERYEQAMEVFINDAHLLLETWGKSSLTKTQVRAAKEALVSPVACGVPMLRGASDASLATVVDAVTFAAQGEADMFRQREMERAAASIMSRGLRVADRTGNVIEIQA